MAVANVDVQLYISLVGEVKPGDIGDGDELWMMEKVRFASCDTNCSYICSH